MEQNNYNQNRYGQQPQYQQQYQQPQYPQPQYQQQYQQPQYPQQQYQQQYPQQQYPQQQYQQQYPQPQQYARPQQQYPQPQYAQQSYVPQQYQQQGGRPAVPLATDFSLVKFFFLGIVTLGIYPIIIMSRVSTYINTIASRYDGKNTMHYCLVFFLFSWLTFGILPIIWYHNTSSRIGAELKRRGIRYSFGAGTFWLWDVLGAFIICGPFIYTHKLLTAMNLLASDYNIRG